MGINVFEGARRITKLAAILCVVGISISQFQSIYDPYVDTYFQVDSPDSAPFRMDGKENNCDPDDATEYLSSLHTRKGTKINATLCFKTRVFGDGRKLIPIWVEHFTEINQLSEWMKINKDQKGTLKYEAVEKSYQEKINQNNKNKAWAVGVGFDKYSTEVTSYTNKVTDSFNLSKADEEWADNEVWAARWDKIKDYVLYIVGGLAFIWMFSWIVGWIVRGFFGIPSGHDFKP